MNIPFFNQWCNVSHHYRYWMLFRIYFCTLLNLFDKYYLIPRSSDNLSAHFMSVLVSSGESVNSAQLLGKKWQNNTILSVRGPRASERVRQLETINGANVYYNNVNWFNWYINTAVSLLWRTKSTQQTRGTLSPSIWSLLIYVKKINMRADWSVSYDFPNWRKMIRLTTNMFFCKSRSMRGFVFFTK